MEKRKQKIEEFFASYESHFNEALAGNEQRISLALAESFAECFTESSPNGVVCGQNDAQFKTRIEEGLRFYKSIGSESMQILDREITLLGQDHALCKVTWQYSYRKDNSLGTIDFDVYYFLRTLNDQIRIFGYITGDEQQALKEHGLI